MTIAVRPVPTMGQHWVALRGVCLIPEGSIYRSSLTNFPNNDDHLSIIRSQLLGWLINNLLTRCLPVNKLIDGDFNDPFCEPQLSKSKIIRQPKLRRGRRNWRRTVGIVYKIVVVPEITRFTSWIPPARVHLHRKGGHKKSIYHKARPLLHPSSLSTGMCL